MSAADARLLRVLRDARERLEADERRRREPIAIVGMACRFPGDADSPDRFWRLLRDGVDATRDVPAGRWDVDGYFDPDPDAPGKMYVRRGGFLGEDEIEMFEPEMFGITPREAEALDPQQRLLLEVTWEALESAGIAPDSLAGTATGVFVGLCFDDYARRTITSGDPSRIDAYSALGSCRSVAAGRVAYVFGLQGPVMQLDTSCSSSLVALHLASQSLRTGECERAIVAGVNVICSPEANIAFCKLRALAPDGRCKTFDAGANGYARGEGCGVVVLRRLSDAVPAGDAIRAVVRGSAVNHDGRSNGLTAPSGAAQEAVIRSALANAGVRPSEVGYVEAHGTGTPLGDPIEISALARAYKADARPPLYVGSVKTNVGHLEGAAGIIGVMKAALALEHGEIPPHLHFHTPNTHILWDQIPLRVPTAIVPWPRGADPRLAAVSAFGMSGTNAHVLIEEPPAAPARARADEVHQITVSARTESALNEYARRLAQAIEVLPADALADACFTINNGRATFAHQRTVSGRTNTEIAAALRSPEEVRLKPDTTTAGSVVASGFSRTIALPTYPFERRRFWIENRETPRPTAEVPDETRTLVSGRDLPEYVRQTVAAAMAIEPGDLPFDRPLYELGVDSIMLAEIATAVHRDLGVDLAVQSAGSGTAADLIASLERARTVSTPPVGLVDAYEDDAVLGSSVIGRPGSKPSEPAQAVLLTGATGFLGAFLLQELIAQTGAHVFCLVRAADERTAAARVRDNLDQYGLGSTVAWDRVTALPGDLGEPRLGLSESRFTELAGAIDAIYSNGAHVSYVATYPELKASHVGGTLEVLRLATQGRPKAVHHVSSVAAFEARAYRGAEMNEEMPPVDGRGIHLAYSQCKWVSDALVREASARNVPVTLYRPSLVSGHSATGSWNTNDFLCRMLKGIVRLGAVPSGLDLLLDFSPVDYVSRAVVWLSRRPTSVGRAFHLQHPAPLAWSGFIDILLGLGYELELVPFAEWVARVEHLRDESLYPLLPFFRHRWVPDNLTYIELNQRQYRARLSCVATAAALAGGEIVCPPLGQPLFERYFSYFSRVGFLDSAPQLRQ